MKWMNNNKGVCVCDCACDEPFWKVLDWAALGAPFPTISAMVGDKSFFGLKAEVTLNLARFGALIVINT
jgi:hypothetical protein